CRAVPGLITYQDSMQYLSMLDAEQLVKNLVMVDPIQAEGAKIDPQLTPGRKQPDWPEIGERQRPDGPSCFARHEIAIPGMDFELAAQRPAQFGEIEGDGLHVAVRGGKERGVGHEITKAMRDHRRELGEG